MQHKITGQYFHAGSSKNTAAYAIICLDGSLLINDAENDTCLLKTATGNYHFGSVIPGLPVELQLADGALFIPDDKLYRWPQLTKKAGIAAWLESHKLSIAAAVLLSPVLMWWLITGLMPMLASAAVPLVPESLKQQMGQQTFYALQKSALQPSSLPEERQQQVRQSWQLAKEKLPLQQQKNYQLYFFQSDMFGANAFALPDGTIVITDDLVNLLHEQPDAILAVLLHEIGHVEAEHSVRLVAQSLGTTLLFSIVFGSPDGLADLLLGSGSVLLQSAFSRDMEREADQFALQQLTALGKSPAAFADAMTALLQKSGSKSESAPALLKYLSTHPETSERIEQALQQQPEN